MYVCVFCAWISSLKTVLRAGAEAKVGENERFGLSNCCTRQAFGRPGREEFYMVRREHGCSPKNRSRGEPIVWLFATLRSMVNGEGLIDRKDRASIQRTLCTSHLLGSLLRSHECWPTGAAYSLNFGLVGQSQHCLALCQGYRICRLIVDYLSPDDQNMEHQGGYDVLNTR